MIRPKDLTCPKLSDYASTPFARLAADYRSSHQYYLGHTEQHLAG